MELYGLTDQQLDQEAVAAGIFGFKTTGAFYDEVVVPSYDDAVAGRTLGFSPAEAERLNRRPDLASELILRDCEAFRWDQTVLNLRFHAAYAGAVPERRRPLRPGRRPTRTPSRRSGRTVAAATCVTSAASATGSDRSRGEAVRDADPRPLVAAAASLALPPFDLRGQGTPDRRADERRSVSRDPAGVRRRRALRLVAPQPDRLGPGEHAPALERLRRLRPRPDAAPAAARRGRARRRAAGRARLRAALATGSAPGNPGSGRSSKPIGWCGLTPPSRCWHPSTSRSRRSSGKATGSSRRTTRSRRSFRATTVSTASINPSAGGVVVALGVVGFARPGDFFDRVVVPTFEDALAGRALGVSAGEEDFYSHGMEQAEGTMREGLPALPARADPVEHPPLPRPGRAGRRRPRPLRREDARRAPRQAIWAPACAATFAT